MSQGEGKVAAALATQQQLLDAHAIFERHKADRQFFLELDLAARLDPQALVGRQVRVLWPDDEAWYLGTVTNYDPSSAEHLVRMVASLLAVQPLLSHDGWALP